MRRLVALDLPGGAAFVDELRRCLDDGDAVLPIDQRLPDRAKALLVAELGATDVVGPTDRVRRRDGWTTEAGDAVVVATSGTTGVPKGVVLTLKAVAASAAATSSRLGVDPTRDRWLCCLPLNHVGGLSVLTRAILTDTPFEVHPGFDPESVAAALERGATLVSLVPTALSRISPRVASAFRRIVLGGSVPPEVLAANVTTTYGLTESGSGVVYDGTALDGVEVEVRSDGEVALRGPMLLRAYRDGRDPKEPSGFLPTGDLGALDADGRLVVSGRREDVIVSGGEKIWPAPVEAVLARHPSVADVALIGVPDTEWQARAVACVVPSPGADVTLAELRALVSAELGPVHAPRELVLFEALPRTSIGKLRRSVLVESLRGATIAR